MFVQQLQGEHFNYEGHTCSEEFKRLTEHDSSNFSTKEHVKLRHSLLLNTLLKETGKNTDFV